MREQGSKMNPMALQVADAAKLLSAAFGKRVAIEMIEKDISGGAPTNADGTVNLVHYAAWLIREVGRSGD